MSDILNVWKKKTKWYFIQIDDLFSTFCLSSREQVTLSILSFVELTVINCEKCFSTVLALLISWIKMTFYQFMYFLSINRWNWIVFRVYELFSIQCTTVNWLSKKNFNDDYDDIFTCLTAYFLDWYQKKFLISPYFFTHCICFCYLFETKRRKLIHPTKSNVTKKYEFLNSNGKLLPATVYYYNSDEWRKKIEFKKKMTVFCRDYLMASFTEIRTNHFHNVIKYSL